MARLRKTQADDYRPTCGYVGRESSWISGWVKMSVPMQFHVTLQIRQAKEFLARHIIEPMTREIDVIGTKP